MLRLDERACDQVCTQEGVWVFERPRGASSIGKGVRVRHAAPDRQERVGVQEWMWLGSAPSPACCVFRFMVCIFLQYIFSTFRAWFLRWGPAVLESVPWVQLGGLLAEGRGPRARFNRCYRKRKIARSTKETETGNGKGRTDRRRWLLSLPSCRS